MVPLIEMDLVEMTRPVPVRPRQATSRTKSKSAGRVPPSSRWVTPIPASADLPSVPAHAYPHRTPAQLLVLARRGLDEAAETRTDGLRYAAAHLAALRAAAAVVAARAKPVPTRRSLSSDPR